MEKIQIYTNKVNNKIKKLLAHALVRAVVVSVITTVLVLVFIGSVLLHYRGKLFAVLAEGYAKNTQPLLATDRKTIPVEELLSQKENNTTDQVSQNTIVSAVQKANPAVVAITITKEIPKYDISYKENTSPPNFFFNEPIYTQNGTEKKVLGGGSGFLVSSDGYVVTNRHVVAETDAEYSITLNTGKKYIAQVLARDTVLDVAILKIDKTGLPYLELGDSNTLVLGQSVIAIGNALAEFKNTVSTGIISGLSRKVVAGNGRGGNESLDKVIQTDAAINPGNSGGPLLDLSGKVIGVNVAVAQSAENIGFALPINTVKSVISQVRSTGKISRPYVGVRYLPVTAELKAKNNLAVDYGILIAKEKDSSQVAVAPGSPADRAGILENDIILEVDGKKIDEDQDFSSLIREKKVGATVTFKVLSNGIIKTVHLILEKAVDN